MILAMKMNYYGNTPWEFFMSALTDVYFFLGSVSDNKLPQLVSWNEKVHYLAGSLLCLKIPKNFNYYHYPYYPLFTIFFD